jgi:hypothetical protein
LLHTLDRVLLLFANTGRGGPPPPPAPLLQIVLGFRGTRGHRLWRRVKPALAKRGHIEEYLARSADDRAVK